MGCFHSRLLAVTPPPKNVPLARQIDDVVPSLLVLPAGTDLHDHPMVKDGRLVLQGAPDFYQTHAGVARFDVIGQENHVANTLNQVSSFFVGKLTL